MIAMPNSAAVMLPLDPTDAVLQRFARLEQQRLWPNGPRHLGVDALGVLVMVGLARTLGDPAWIDRAEALVGEVDRVLRRRRGYRAGEGALRDEQVFHELAVWVFALAVLGEERPGYRARAVEVVREVHRAFVAPGQGVHARRGEDVDHASPDTGFGALDPIRGWVVYRVIDEVGLAEEIAEMEQLLRVSYPRLRVDRDVALGSLLWLLHFFPDDLWARVLRERVLASLERMWLDGPGCFSRGPQARNARRALGNHAIALGLRANGLQPDRVARTHLYWETERWRGADRGIAPQMIACASLLPVALLRRGPADFSAAGVP